MKPDLDVLTSEGEILFGNPRIKVIETPKIIVGDPIHEANTPLFDTNKKPIDGKKLTSAERELGVGFKPEIDFLGIEDPDLYKDVVAEVNEANNIVNELRLKSVGVYGLTPYEEKLLEIKNGYISDIYSIRDQGILNEQQQMEAEAKMLVQEAELILVSDLEDETQMKAVYAKLSRIAEKLGPKTPMMINTKLTEIKNALEQKKTKKESDSPKDN